MVRIDDVMDFFEKTVPTAMKMDFDNVGFLVGKITNEVTKALVALDITDEVIEEAIEMGAELIISHHPMFFKVKSVTNTTREGRKVIRMLENGVSAICLHTNLDTVAGGVSDALIEKLGCKNFGALEESENFKNGQAYGMGRHGEFTNPMTMPELMHLVKEMLNTNGQRYHDAGRPVKQIAVCGGSGGDLIDTVLARGCDTYITADIKYHQFLHAVESGLNIIDAGHYSTENLIVPVIADMLRGYFREIEVEISKRHVQCIDFYS